MLSLSRFDASAYELRALSLGDAARPGEDVLLKCLLLQDGERRASRQFSLGTLALRRKSEQFFLRRRQLQHFVFVISLSILPAQGVSRTQAAKDLARQHKLAVEHHLLCQTVITGAPDSGMSLEKRMAQLRVPGVSVAVIHEGHTDWTGSYGVVRLEGRHVTADTLFNAASMSKPLTAMAVMKLVQDGRIDLDVDINSYLKSWKIPDNQYTKDHPVTVRELLNHTSGIGTHNGEVDDPDKGLPTMLQMLNGEPPSTSGRVRVEAVPGSRYAYANGGYLILQLLVTEVARRPFAEYMQETVLRPMGMNHSTFHSFRSEC